MEKNYQGAAMWIVLAVLAVVLSLMFVPEFTIERWTSRGVDLLSDVRHGAGKGYGTVHDSVVYVSVDSVKPGVVNIVDLYRDEPQSMETFYRALDSLATLGRPVRIAVLGDSFIEGDLLTAQLRSILQQRFGGSGVGMVPIATNTSRNRISVRQTYEGWTTHKITDRKGLEYKYMNLTASYFTGSDGAFNELVCNQRYLPGLASCNNATLYYTGGDGTGRMLVSANGGAGYHHTMPCTTEVGTITVTAPQPDSLRSVRWTLTKTGGEVFVGIAMDPDRGVVLDNYGMRSSSGRHLSVISPDMLRAFDKARHYDLVVIMYGLNVARPHVENYITYGESLSAGLDSLKSALPNTSLLVVSCSDREERWNGGFRTMPGIRAIIAQQRATAKQCHVPFWDLYTAMGGEGSMVNMVTNNEASRDYTHINHKGGEKVAQFFADALLWGYECHRMGMKKVANK